MKKKIGFLAIILALACITILGATVAQAAGEVVNWRLYNDGTLIINGDNADGHGGIKASGKDFNTGTAYGGRDNPLPWESNLTDIVSVQFANPTAPTNTEHWFQNCSNLTTFDDANLDMSSVTKMDSMFSNCGSLRSVDFHDWNVSRVTSMYGLFEQCQNLETVNLSNWDVSHATNMNCVFARCPNLREIDIYNWKPTAGCGVAEIFSEDPKLERIWCKNTWEAGTLPSYGLFSGSVVLESTSSKQKYSANRVDQDMCSPETGYFSMKVLTYTAKIQKKMVDRSGSPINNWDFTANPFTFTISAPDGSPLPENTSATTDASGLVSFDSVELEYGSSYYYEIREAELVLGPVGPVQGDDAILNNGDGSASEIHTATPSPSTLITMAADGTTPIQLDSATHYLLVSVSESGTVTETWDNKQQTPTITNVAGPLDTFAPTIHKQVRNANGDIIDNWDFDAHPFSFTISSPDGAPLPAETEATTDADGTVTWDEVEFLKPGTYTYEITEQRGSEPDVTYDTSTHTIQVVIDASEPPTK